ncbi:RelA/SpoT domain-containing protein [Pseudomonas viridiflava]|uniref:RelA/SpoT domain-containing protein n=1 Tax=Pseudomonas viridiflava TaxID=33069 RepID=UPI002E9ED3A7|nr:RelA/SpoT domain-containing protein [Pseudomonas viridiflava]
MAQVHVIPLYSKERVKKAGSTLINMNCSLVELNEALEVLNNWRSSHTYPVNTFQAGLRQKMKKMGIEGIVAQRLKRIPSIFSKLIRFKQMSLSRMQDIGGLRAVVGTKKEVYLLRDSYVKHSKFDHVLMMEKDYIEEPKDSGYRGIHLVYKYSNRKIKLYDGLQIEIQIRNEIQHSWATAVETAGVFLDQALKSSLGNEDWLEFFCYASSCFAIQEKAPSLLAHRHMVPSEIFNKMLELENQLGVVKALETYNSVLETLQDTSSKTHYYLMSLDPSRKTIDIQGYERDQLETATSEYLTQEKEAKNTPGVQVVLVAAQSLNALKKAYPNYFLDTGKFVGRIKRIRKLMSVGNSAAEGPISPLMRFLVKMTAK